MAVRNALLGYDTTDPNSAMFIDPSLMQVSAVDQGLPPPDAPPPDDSGGGGGGGGGGPWSPPPIVGPAGRQTPFYIPPSAYPIDWSKLQDYTSPFGALQGMPTPGPGAAPLNDFPSMFGIQGGDDGSGEDPGPPGGSGGAPPEHPDNLVPLKRQSNEDYLRDLFTGRNRDTLAGSQPGVDFSTFDVTKMGTDFDPAFLLKMKPWLDSIGAKLQIKPSDNGIPSGRIVLSDGRSVDLNLGGKWGWLDRGVITEGATTGAGGGKSGTSAGPGFSLNQGMSSAIDDAIMRMLQTGTGPWGQQTYDWLQRVLNTGGLYNDPLVKAQLIKARDAEAGAFNSQLADARGALADRGLLSAPGVNQGAEAGTIARLTESLGTTYAANVSQIEIEAMDRANQNMMSALSLATGLSEDQSHNMLSAIGLGTQRQVALADLALRQLEQDTNWQMFLANYGLSVDTLRNQIENNNWQNVLQLVMAFLQHVQVGQQGS